MVEIKTMISFDEFRAIANKVVNDCFNDGTYDPTLYNLSFNTALLTAFAPDFDLSGCEDNNALWERISTKEAKEVIDAIYYNEGSSDIRSSLSRAIRESLDYRIKATTSGTMSITDIALSKLIDTINEKVEKIDTSMLSKENIDAIVQAVNTTKDGNFAESLVDTMLDKGIIAKPNRQTRRNNIKQTKKAENTEQ